MNKNLILTFMLLLFCYGLSATNLSSSQEQQVRNVVGNYCRLLSDFSKSREFYSNQDKIIELFPKEVGDVAKIVVDDINTMQRTDIMNYLSNLVSPDKYYYSLQISFLENVKTASVSGYSTPNYKKPDVVKYGEITLTKQITGKINKNVKNTFYVNLTNNKIERIIVETQQDFFTRGLKYYNDTPKDYEKALVCFRNAAEMGEEESMYYCAVMLLKKQGCKHIPENVRNAEAMFWLKKLRLSKYWIEEASNILGAWGVDTVNIDYVAEEDTPYNEGLIKIWKGDKIGFADELGKIFIPCKYKSASAFKDGLAKVMLNDKIGFIDKTDKIVIPIKYETADLFTEDGLAAVKLNGKIGYIDKTGKTIIPFEYDAGRQFVNGMAAVKLNGKFGYISPLNKMVISAIYDNAEDFKESYPENENIKLAIVKSNNKYYKLGSDGNIYYVKDEKGVFQKIK